MKQKDPTESRSMLIGNLVHTLILEPEEFDKKYVMSVCNKKPTGKMLKFVDALYKHTILNSVDDKVVVDFKVLAEKAREESGYEHSLQVILNKFTGKEPEKYYRELRETKEKQVVCLEDLSIANGIVSKLKTSDAVNSIFTSGYSEVKYENFEIGGLKFKGMVDKILDFNTYLKPYDLKVTWTNENFYEEYFLKTYAYLQAAIYYEAVKQNNPTKEVKPPAFIVADSTNVMQPLIYEISEESLKSYYNGFTYRNEYYKGLNEVIEEIKWHMDTNIWDISYNNYKNNNIIWI